MGPYGSGGTTLAFFPKSFVQFDFLNSFRNSEYKCASLDGLLSGGVLKRTMHFNVGYSVIKQNIEHVDLVTLRAARHRIARDFSRPWIIHDSLAFVRDYSLIWTALANCGKY